MNSLHIRRSFLKLVGRSGLIGVSVLGAGTAVSLSNARSAQSQQTSDGSQVRIGDTLICSGTVPMIIPQGGAHVRQVDIRLPKYSPNPTVTATTYSTESPGNVFGIFSIKINDLGNQTQVVITATNVEKAQAVPYPYFCNYIVIGKSPAL